MTVIRYARGASKFDAHPGLREVPDFDAFERAVLADRARSKGQQYICAPFKVNGDGTPHRGKDDVEPRRFLALDVDHIANSEVFTDLRLWLTRFHGFGFTTASSTADAPRCRVILELSREVDRIEGMRLGAAIARDLGEEFGSDVRLDHSTHRGEQPCYGPVTRSEPFRLDGEAVGVDTWLDGAPEIEPERKSSAAIAPGDDPIIVALKERGMYRRDLGAGRHAIRCPWEAEHTSEDDDQSTTTCYMQPHHAGFVSAGFKCLHEHCARRTGDDLLAFLGVDWRQVADAYKPDSKAAQSAPARGEVQPDAGDPDGWPDPLPLLAKVEPEPYPLDALPDTIQAAVIEVQGFTKAPIPMVASSALAALSLAFQAHADVQRAEKLTGPVGLFLLTIADSGERKSTCDGFFTTAIRDHEAQQAEAAKPAIKDYEAAKRAWVARQAGTREKIKSLAKAEKPTSALERVLRDLEDEKPEAPRVPKLLRGDDTPENLAWVLSREWPSSGVLSSEAGIVLGAHGMGRDSIMRNLGLLNILWDGGVLSIGRRTSESFTVRGARLTMALQVQEATLRSFFDRSGGLARGTGFLARFLVAWPESTQGFRPFTEAPANWPHLAAYNRRIAAILNQQAPLDEAGALTPPMLSLAPDAKAAWIDYHNAIEGELASSGELYDVRDVASKSADNAARLAALFHVFVSSNSSISVSSIQTAEIESACRIAAWHLNESRRFFGELALPVELANAARLDTWLIELPTGADAPCPDCQVTARRAGRTAQQGDHRNRHARIARGGPSAMGAGRQAENDGSESGAADRGGRIVTISALIRKRGAGKVANDNHAKAANDGQGKAGSLARLAPLALANPTSPEDVPLPDPTAEARRQSVLAMLAERPGIGYAVVVNAPDADPVIVALAIRDVGTCELAIPAANYDAFALLALIERHGATVH